VKGLARAVGQGDIASPVYARAVTWRGERPLVGHAGPRWLLAQAKMAARTALLPSAVAT
jgi:hypothetical protein